MRTACYLRISQDRQGLSLGIDRQREDCTQLAASRGWDLVAVFADNDLSATKGKRRPGYVDLMAAVERGEIDRVIVYQTSRLWRNRRERVTGMELFQAKGIGLVPVRGPELDFSSASGRMVAGILGELDTAEVEVKSERATRKVLQKVQGGEYLGGPRMFGIRTNGRDLDEVEADVVRRMYKQILAGGSIYSLRRQTGKNHASIVAILRNPRCRGVRILHGVEYPASNPALVDDTTWHAVNAILDDPSRRKQTGTAYRWFGAGLYRCAECDRTVRTSMSGHGYRSYSCASVAGGCGRVWRADRIDEYVVEVIAERLSRDDVPELIPADDRITPLALEAAALRTRLDVLMDHYTDGALTEAQLLRGTEKMRTRLAEVETAMSAAVGDNTLAGLGADPAQAWRDMTSDAIMAPPARKTEKTIVVPPARKTDSDPGRARAVARVLCDISLRPSPRGRARLDWNPDTVVQIDWR